MNEISLEVAESLVKSRANTVKLEGLVNASPEVLRTLQRQRRTSDSILGIRLSDDIERRINFLPRIDNGVNR